ncbi:hypothetical protein MMC30_008679 [Trapelia coarctata]|nr:hypothetical protein [Trapelia coarctata]
MAGVEESDVPGGNDSRLETQILPVDISRIHDIESINYNHPLPIDWNLSSDTATLLKAARHLRETAIPVAFPTETVYGLGADATRRDAVRGIYKAKQRPADNPLIVHICSLDQLRSLLQPQAPIPNGSEPNGHINDFHDPIPAIYQPLIQRFWPGPLTILLPNPPNSILAPEVTAGLPTFGARMPSSPLALVLIRLAGVPLAAPSANASTKPSPTTAQHVKYDLDGRIEIIIDGGPSNVGVESTVVDGLSDPPMILRPGGVSLEQLRQCKGWENTAIGYKDCSELEKAPRAPGMKYKHYSPKAKVVLVEHRDLEEEGSVVQRFVDQGARRLGVLRTKYWKPLSKAFLLELSVSKPIPSQSNGSLNGPRSFGTAKSPNLPAPIPHVSISAHDIHLGTSVAEIARGLFSALRALDLEGVEVIFVEGIDNQEGEGAAVMNRLRKAAEEVI